MIRKEVRDGCFANAIAKKMHVGHVRTCEIAKNRYFGGCKWIFVYIPFNTAEMHHVLNIFQVELAKLANTET